MTVIFKWNRALTYVRKAAVFGGHNYRIAEAEQAASACTKHREEPVHENSLNAVLAASLVDLLFDVGGLLVVLLNNDVAASLLLEVEGSRSSKLFFHQKRHHTRTNRGGVHDSYADDEKTLNVSGTNSSYLSKIVKDLL